MAINRNFKFKDSLEAINFANKMADAIEGRRSSLLSIMHQGRNSTGLAAMSICSAGDASRLYDPLFRPLLR